MSWIQFDMRFNVVSIYHNFESILNQFAAARFKFHQVYKTKTPFRIYSFFRNIYQLFVNFSQTAFNVLLSSSNQEKIFSILEFRVMCCAISKRCFPGNFQGLVSSIKWRGRERNGCRKGSREWSGYKWEVYKLDARYRCGVWVCFGRESTERNGT